MYSISDSKRPCLMSNRMVVDIFLCRLVANWWTNLFISQLSMDARGRPIYYRKVASLIVSEKRLHFKSRVIRWCPSACWWMPHACKGHYAKFFLPRREAWNLRESVSHILFESGWWSPLLSLLWRWYPVGIVGCWGYFPPDSNFSCATRPRWNASPLWHWECC